MRRVTEVQGIQVEHLDAEEGPLGVPAYEIREPNELDSVRLPAKVAPRLALELLKDVFLGNGKPYAAAEALRCLEDLLPRVEADPVNWWNG